MYMTQSLQHKPFPALRPFTTTPKMGGPYASNTAGMGGVPTITLDIPICVVFMVIYLSFAATNMAIFQVNRRRKHKFVLSGLMFGFCMARTVTNILRIAWATRQHNIQLVIAAQILVNAGVLIIYIINLILAQRILRAMQPHIGWNPFLRATYKVLYVSIGASLAMVITSVVVSLYTLSPHAHSICRSIQLAALTYLLIFTTLPILHLALAILLPTHKNAETFGHGSMRTKIIILATSTTLCMLIAGFKSGVAWSPPRPAIDPAWYDSKACFYCFNFMIEVCILVVLTGSRIDKRFHVPDGSNEPGHYTRFRERGAVETLESEKNDDSDGPGKGDSKNSL